MEEMEEMLEILEDRLPDSRLIPLYRKAIEKGATISCDDHWWMWYKDEIHSANSIGELMEILNS